MEDILEDPSRFINADESNFMLCPRTGKVLGPKGWSNVYEILAGSEKDTLTVLGTFAANGVLVPGMIIYPYVKPPRELVESVPEGWSIGRSDNGWMKSETFYEYVVNILNPWLDENGIKKPVLFFIDGAKTHLTLHLSNFCAQNGIELYCLYPNATHIIQPADVSVFRPIKLGWRQAVHKWQGDNPNKCLTKVNFAPLLANVFTDKATPATIRSGFRACGLFPLDPNAVDYSKCVRDLQRKGTNDVGTAPQSNDYKIASIVVDREIPEHVLDAFQRAKAGDEDVTERYQELFNVWNIIHMKATKKQGQQVPSLDQEATDRSPPTEERDTCEVEPLITPTSPTEERQEYEDQTLLNATPFEDRIERENQALRVLISSDMGLNDKEKERISKPDDPVPSTSGVQSVLTLPSVQNIIQVTQRRSISPAFDKHLYWPEQPKSQGKRKRQKLPHAISSETWRAHYQEKDEEKAKKEQEKNQRAEERLKKKEEKATKDAERKKGRGKRCLQK